MTVVNHAYYDPEIGETLNVCLADLDPGINEHIVKNGAEDVYTIFINARSSADQQRESFEHARKHIKNGDWDKVYVQSIEAAAHGIPQAKEPVKEEDPSFALKFVRRLHSNARKRLEEYYRRLEKRQNRLRAQGWEEVTIIEEDEYGVPRVRLEQRRMKWQDADDQ